jgi:hypothetical protein
MTTNPALAAASREAIATEKELAAAIANFQAAVYRECPVRLSRATEAAHAALQNHLDAKASIWAVAKREFE